MTKTPTMTEDDFLATVLDLASWAGWRRFHPRPAQYQSGRWATHYSGDQGFPDLVLVHPRHGCIFAELKSDTGRPTAAQEMWIQDLRHAGAEVYLWRPSDLEQIKDRLRFPRGGRLLPKVRRP